MINYWWVSRPKRKLNSIPEVLAKFSEISINETWEGQRNTHLSLEDALEKAGLKREGDRRDQTGGGARTYKAWVASLGLIFTQESTNKIFLTLAGEAILNGDSPVEVLKNQILKYQFPSPFSLSRNVSVHDRFKIRPFRFLLRLLNDNRISFLSEKEIAEIIILQAENETDKCYECIVNKLLHYRSYENELMVSDFEANYGTTEKNLKDVANTIVNWLEYTQIVERGCGEIRIFEEKRKEVEKILSVVPPFIDRPYQQEYFQRKFGVDPRHKKDSRDLNKSITVTANMILESSIRKAFINIALARPITKINQDLINEIVESVGIQYSVVEDCLFKIYPHGAIRIFMNEYFEMAFKGRDEATAFEKATSEIFRNVFLFQSEHIGQKGLTPDVVVISDEFGFSGIIDNKAYSKYSINNDHKNRMIHNYIPKYKNFKKCDLAFFMYIAGGFSNSFEISIKNISRESKVNGSGISVVNLIKMIEKQIEKPYCHLSLRSIFSLNRLITPEDMM
ncbi:Restriction endonuclease FokI, C terminal [Alkalispirochaeta americana]|uniref:Restriction endonuclease FokI, C terminal n=1 Tax=Alkalispirochaeta americana TaxID=159291 RepID=A0A1N6XYH3_9SPIO|nr:restriction endonuclease FokI C-terminal domain-containing protein [Alkalispirochaeta americana]SIR07410.1 Restriction endonuclease FokI, C terminal [Alkalispirochaeta americana]